MLTTHEKRVLYVLRKNGGRALRMTISQAMARLKAAERDAALLNLEHLELISSAKKPPVRGKGKGASGGQGGTEYWLTEAGTGCVDNLISLGQMKDPKLEPRRRKA